MLWRATDCLNAIHAFSDLKFSNIVDYFIYWSMASFEIFTLRLLIKSFSSWEASFEKRNVLNAVLAAKERKNSEIHIRILQSIGQGEMYHSKEQILNFVA